MCIAVVVEQNRLLDLVNNSKVLLLPVGICPRENLGERGKELRDVLTAHRFLRSAHVRNNDNHNHGYAEGYEEEIEVLSSYVVPEVYNAAVHLPIIRKLQIALNVTANTSHRNLLQEAKSAALPWKDRKDRIFVCFNVGSYVNRKRYMDFARENCTVCDHCTGIIPVSALWRQYGQYKYILSPWGNGMDCGRSWEILIMGAVPVFEYFAGAYGYGRAGLSTVLVREPEDLNPRNVSEWGRFTHAQDPSKLTYDFWTARIFNETFM